MHRKIIPVWKIVRNYTKGFENHTVVMVRHGESEYNKSNLFTGWFDSRLSEKGKEEAKLAGQTLYRNNYQFDVAFTSRLIRAKHSLHIMLNEIHQPEIPIRSSWRLNERHYGELTGLNKSEMSIKYGSKQVTKWRREFRSVPPPIRPNHKHYESIRDDPRYNEEDMAEFPMSESLEMTLERTLPYWNDVIVPEIKDGKRILIVGHGNSLRGVVKHLDQVSEEDVTSLYIPTGIPFLYILDENFMPVPNGSLLYMGDPELVKQRINTMSNKSPPGRKKRK